MCGIFALYKGTLLPYMPCFHSTKHRGPDNSKLRMVAPNINFGFHRLSINGLDRVSDQPLQLYDKVLICNGEIYNYKQLAEKYDFSLKTHSDCEIIIHLYKKFGIEDTCKLLDGVFSFALYDFTTKQLYAARDPIGIRALYYGYSGDGSVSLCSEMKGLAPSAQVSQFPPGTYTEITSSTSTPISSLPLTFTPYYNYNWTPIIYEPSQLPIIYSNIRSLFIDAVKKRTMSDRRICSLLSGGLDSTLTTYVLAKHTSLNAVSINTYAIGLEESVDLKYAKIAGDVIGTNHHTIVVTEKQFLDAIEKTIVQIESYCVTSVRASTGNFLVSLAIADCADGDTVVFCGDLSDEIFGSYRGFMKAPTPQQFFEENVEMLKNVHYFDVLRSDKSISGAGLEARVPFADKAFVDYVMTLDPTLKMFNNEDRMEKYILRKAFDGELPDELLWRRKEAFSDGVSGMERSWFQIIQEHVDKLIPDDQFEERRAKYSYNPPTDKESLWYRELFEKHYPGRAKTIPFMWKHPFHDSTADPSARLLDCY